MLGVRSTIRFQHVWEWEGANQAESFLRFALGFGIGIRHSLHVYSGHCETTYIRQGSLREIASLFSTSRIREAG